MTAGGARLARAAVELDPSRQLRRLRRAAAGRTAQDELVEAVSSRRILVTGASSGLGREVALRLIEGGAEVLAVARRRERLDALVRFAETRPGSCRALPCDLADEAETDALVRALIAEGGVDVLVNNAGRSLRRTLADSADRLHDYHRVMRLNFFGAVELTVPLVEQMRRTGGGHVVNVSTMGTQLQGTPYFGAYMASKAALDQFAKSVAAETRREGVRWTTVHMPLVQTEMIEPTAAAWRGHPKLDVTTGAALILDAIVRQPVRVTVPWGVALELVDRLATGPMVQMKSQMVKGEQR